VESQTCTVHLVDDTMRVRASVETMLRDTWEKLHVPSEQCPSIRHWKFIWELAEAVERKSNFTKAGDIVVADLFPAEYWEKVPGPTRFDEEPPLPGDPTNIYRAALDIRSRFLPVLTKAGLHVMIVTVVPRWIEEMAMGGADYSKPAEHVRRLMREDGLELVEKEDRDLNIMQNYAPAVVKVNALLGFSANSS
jgi:hypothetical protein